MATTLDDIIALANNATFKGRVTAAVLYVATETIRTNLEVADLTGDIKAQIRLAESAIADPDNYGAQFARVLATRTAITDTSNDAAILTAVQGAWRFLARIIL